MAQLLEEKFNLNTLNLPNRKERFQHHTVSSWQGSHSFLCQKEILRSHIYPNYEFVSLGKSQRGKEPRSGEIEENQSKGKE